MIEEAGCSRQRNDRPRTDVPASSCRRPVHGPKLERPDHRPLLSLRWGALLLAMWCVAGAFEYPARLLLSRRSRMPRCSSHPRRHGGIVSFDPRPHTFRRFHIKARLLSHQDKGLGHTSVGWLLQRLLQALGGLRPQVRQQLLGLRQLVDTL